MPKKNNKTILILIPMLAVIICLFLWYAIQSQNYTPADSDTAVWDLRGMSFERYNYRLGGPVEYIPNALLTPEEFHARESEAVVGYPEDVSQYATSRMLVYLPNDNYYTFFTRSIDYATRLYINGEWIEDMGKPGDTKESTIPNTGKLLLTVKPVNGVVEIIQQGANFVHREGGGHAGWRVGTSALMEKSLFGDFSDTIQIGSFLALFFVHIILFLLLRSYRANLYFALFCLMWLLRTGVTGPKVFTVLFPWLPWVAKFRIEYLAFPVTAVLMVSLLDTMFPHILQKWFRYAIYGVSAVVALLFLFTDTVFMSYALPFCEAVYIPAILYIAARFIIKLRSVSVEQAVFLVGLALFLYAAVHDMFYYNDILLFPVGDLSSISMLLLTFCEAAAIFIATVREVENAKAQEQRLAVENAALDRINRLKTDLMQTIFHELRTPLAVMVGFAELTAEDARMNDMDLETAANLDAIASEGKRMADMLEEIRGMALVRGFPKDKHPLSMEDVIRQLTGLYRIVLERKGIQLETDIEEGLPPVFGNEGELTQVLFNLLRNADRHTESGTVTVKAQRKNDLIQVTVSDTGTGISAELLPHVFERGVSGGDGGTGLGLSISRDIIEAHGGKIWLESAEGNGATAIFTLPSYKGGDTNG